MKKRKRTTEVHDAAALAEGLPHGGAFGVRLASGAFPFGGKSISRKSARLQRGQAKAAKDCRTPRRCRVPHCPLAPGYSLSYFKVASRAEKLSSPENTKYIFLPSALIHLVGKLQVSP